MPHRVRDFVAGLRLWKPQVGKSRQAKIGRKHADYGECLAVELNGRADQIRIPVEIFQPQAMAQKSDGRGVGRIVGGFESAAQYGTNSEDREKAGADTGGLHAD